MQRQQSFQNNIKDEYKVNLIFEKGKETISKYSVFGMPKEFILETKTDTIGGIFILIDLCKISLLLKE